MVINMWEEMYEKAKEIQARRRISPFVETGAAASAILTDKGNIYLGISIDTGTANGICAERNAISNMITYGESKIIKMLTILRDGAISTPCNSCLEFIMMLDKDSQNIDVLTDYNPISTMKLKRLCPNWWISNSLLKI